MLVQAGVPLAVAQLLPQAPPQSSTVVIEVSQPASALQSAYPGSQPVWTQLPLMQATVAFGKSASQSVPQVPQLLMVFSGVSQPASPVQSPKPGSQLKLQEPLSQVGEEFGSSVQTMPQSPQLLGSVSRFVQPVAQESGVSPPQLDTQAPSLQTSVPLQTSPQDPQSLLVPSWVSQPSPVGTPMSPLQSTKPLSQAYSHPPVPQARVPLAMVWQLSPHPVQVSTVPSWASQPVLSSPSQSS